MLYFIPIDAHLLEQEVVGGQADTQDSDALLLAEDRAQTEQETDTHPLPLPCQWRPDHYS